MQTYAEVRIDGSLLVPCHYAFRTWRDMSKGSINLHGNSHGRLRPVARQIDLGVDVLVFHPRTLEQMVAQTRRRKLPAR